MGNKRTKGRMINKSISASDGFASLSPQAAVLFCMMIPHYNSHGKMNGGAGYIKDEICPLVPFLTYENIPALLTEISAKTSVKWFKAEGRMWVHSVNFLSDHQTLDVDRLGSDELPDYVGVAADSGVNQELVQSKSGVNQDSPSTSTSTYSYTSNSELTSKLELTNLENNSVNKKEIINRVFEKWKNVHNHPQARLDDKRRKKITDALKLGYTEENLVAAIEGCKNSPFHMGENDGGKIYDDLELILRDAKHLDEFIRHSHSPPASGVSKTGRKNAANLAAFVKKINGAENGK